MAIMERSVHLTTLFLGKLEQAVNLHFVRIFSLVLDKTLLKLFTGLEENDH